MLLGAATAGAPNDTDAGAGLALLDAPNDATGAAPNDGGPAEDAPNPPLTVAASLDATPNAGAGLGAPNMDVAAGAGAGAETPKPKPPAGTLPGPAAGAPNVDAVDEPKPPLEGAVDVAVAGALKPNVDVPLLAEAGAAALLAPNVNVLVGTGAGAGAPKPNDTGLMALLLEDEDPAAGAAAALDPKLNAGFAVAPVAGGKAGGTGAMTSSSNLLGLLFKLPNATPFDTAAADDEDDEDEAGTLAAPNVNGAEAVPVVVAEPPVPVPAAVPAEEPKPKLGLLIAAASAVLDPPAVLFEFGIAPKLKLLLGADAGAGADDDDDEIPKAALELVLGAGAVLVLLGAPNVKAPTAGGALVVFLLTFNPNEAGAGAGAGVEADVLPKEKAALLRFLPAGSSDFDDVSFALSEDSFAEASLLSSVVSVLIADAVGAAPNVKPGVLLELETLVLPPPPNLKPPFAAAGADELFVLLAALLPPKVKPPLEDVVVAVVVAPPNEKPPEPIEPDGGALPTSDAPFAPFLIPSPITAAPTNPDAAVGVVVGFEGDFLAAPGPT